MDLREIPFSQKDFADRRGPVQLATAEWEQMTPLPHALVVSDPMGKLADPLLVQDLLQRIIRIADIPANEVQLLRTPKEILLLFRYESQVFRTNAIFVNGLDNSSCRSFVPFIAEPEPTRAIICMVVFEKLYESNLKYLYSKISESGHIQNLDVSKIRGPAGRAGARRVSALFWTMEGMGRWSRELGRLGIVTKLINKELQMIKAIDKRDKYFLKRDETRGRKSSAFPVATTKFVVTWPEETHRAMGRSPYEMDFVAPHKHLLQLSRYSYPISNLPAPTLAPPRDDHSWTEIFDKRGRGWGKKLKAAQPGKAEGETPARGPGSDCDGESDGPASSISDATSVVGTMGGTPTLLGDTHRNAKSKEGISAICSQGSGNEGSSKNAHPNLSHLRTSDKAHPDFLYLHADAMDEDLQARGSQWQEDSRTYMLGRDDAGPSSGRRYLEGYNGADSIDTGMASRLETLGVLSKTALNKVYAEEHLDIINSKQYLDPYSGRFPKRYEDEAKEEHDGNNRLDHPDPWEKPPKRPEALYKDMGRLNPQNDYAKPRFDSEGNAIPKRGYLAPTIRPTSTLGKRDFDEMTRGEACPDAQPSSSSARDASSFLKDMDLKLPMVEWHLMLPHIIGVGWPSKMEDAPAGALRTPTVVETEDSGPQESSSTGQVPASGSSKGKSGNFE